MSSSEFRVGEYRRHVRLGSEAVYRVCGRDGQLVLLEVVEAPGLRRGHPVRFTAEAVRAMTLVGPSEIGESPAAS